MKAVLFEQPRKVSLVDDALAPEPGDGEVLVRCDFVALCGTNMGPYLGDGRWGQVEWPPPPGWLGHENVGRIVDCLKEIGQFDRTLILFLSDNGGEIGQVIF